VKTKAARSRARAGERKPVPFDLVIEAEGWRKHPSAIKLIRQAASLALTHLTSDAEMFTLLLSDDGRLRRLNREFRGKDRPTNVLAFPSREPGYLGDVAIALGVVEREALEQGKTLPAHGAHLAVHGILHLKGYDHVKAPERTRMEAEEVLILSRLGLSSPYTPRAYARTAKAVD
jgi:probable rRNA maturation factor